MSTRTEITIRSYSTSFTLRVGDDVVIAQPQRTFSAVPWPSTRTRDKVVAVLGPATSPYVKLASGRLFDQRGNERGTRGASDYIEPFDAAAEQHSDYTAQHLAARTVVARLSNIRDDAWLKACLDSTLRQQLAAILDRIATAK